MRLLPRTHAKRRALSLSSVHRDRRVLEGTGAKEAVLRPRAKFFQIDDMPGTRSKGRLELCYLKGYQVAELHFAQVLLGYSAGWPHHG